MWVGVKRLQREAQELSTMGLSQMARDGTGHSAYLRSASVRFVQSVLREFVRLMEVLQEAPLSVFILAQSPRFAHHAEIAHVLSQCHNWVKLQKWFSFNHQVCQLFRVDNGHCGFNEHVITPEFGLIWLQVSYHVIVSHSLHSFRINILRKPVPVARALGTVDSEVLKRGGHFFTLSTHSAWKYVERRIQLKSLHPFQ